MTLNLFCMCRNLKRAIAVAAKRKKRTLKSKDRLVRRKTALEEHLQKVCSTITSIRNYLLLFERPVLFTQTILVEAFKEAIAADKAMETARSSEVGR